MRISFTQFEELVVRKFVNSFPADAYVKNKHVISEDLIYLELIIPSQSLLENVCLIPSQFTSSLRNKELMI